MKIIMATMVASPLLGLVAGALSGRVRLISCCATADPYRDLRMRAALDSDQPPAE